MALGGVGVVVCLKTTCQVCIGVRAGQAYKTRYETIGKEFRFYKGCSLCVLSVFLPVWELGTQYDQFKVGICFPKDEDLSLGIPCQLLRPLHSQFMSVGLMELNTAAILLSH